jgi:hypothetical protein
MVDEHTHSRYLEAIETEAERALRAYGMVVIPGLELTYSDRDPDRAAHALAIGLEEFVPADDGPRAAMRTARTLGAAIIAHTRTPASWTRSLSAPPGPSGRSRTGCGRWSTATRC